MLYFDGAHQSHKKLQIVTQTWKNVPVLCGYSEQ